MTIKKTISVMSKPWLKWQTKIAKHVSINSHQWKAEQIVGYIAFKYQEIFHQPFIFTFNSSPGKCHEMVVIKKIYAQLNSTNGYRIKEYIDWVFEYKITPKKFKFRSFSYFLTPGLVNEYWDYYIKINTITKSTTLPQEYLQIINSLNFSISTYGELSFIYAALQQNDSGREQYQSLMKTLITLGLNLEQLKNL